jgi:hypothetical protein
LKTVIVAGPSVSRSLAGICALSWVLLTKFVVRFAPFHCAIAPLTKPAPVTVSVNAEPPPLTRSGIQAAERGQRIFARLRDGEGLRADGQRAGARVLPCVGGDGEVDRAVACAAAAGGDRSLPSLIRNS